MKSWWLGGLVSAFMCGLSFLPLPIRQEVNEFIEDGFTHLSFRFTANPGAAKKYVVIECPRLPVPETDDSFLDLADCLRKLETLNPSVVILDTNPGVNSHSSLYGWLQGTLKQKMVYIAPEQGKMAALSFQRVRDDSLSNAVFILNQKKNLQVNNLVSEGDKPTASSKAVQLLKGLSEPPNSFQKIHYFFGDGAYLRLNFQEFIKLRFQKNALEGRIVLLRTGSFSSLERPVLTPIGILSSETLLWNDIETLLQGGGEKSVSKHAEKLALMLFLWLLWILFSRANLLTAFLGSLFVLELQFLFGWVLFLKGITLNYCDFIVFPLLFLLFLLLFALKRVSQYQEAMKEMERLKSHLELKNKELFSLKKLSDLGKLSAGIFHEINNPLHNMLNALKMVAGEEGLSKDSKEFLNLALEEVKRLQRLSQNLKRFYQSVPEGKEKLVFVNELLSFALQLLRTSFNTKNIEVFSRLHPKNPAVLAIPDKLQQVFLNLLLNALDAVPTGGKVWMESDLKENQILVTIRDSGPGLSEEARARLFEAFFTTKGEKGTGLGLYVSFEIVNALGGDIEIAAPKEGVGAEFIVRLPSKEEGNQKPI